MGMDRRRYRKRRSSCQILSQSAKDGSSSSHYVPIQFESETQVREPSWCLAAGGSIISGAPHLWIAVASVGSVNIIISST
jgi:hypothetical protein